MIRFWHGYLLHVWQTTVHKGWIAYYLGRYLLSQPGIHGPVPVWDVVRRALVHDLSKYRWDEARAFARTIFDLRTTRYNTVEYKALLAELGPSLKLHYARNSHHPEHFADGYDAMSDADRVEMLCDWAAAVRRHDDGDLERSIVQNMKRFGYDGDEALRLGRLAAAIGAV